MADDNNNDDGVFIYTEGAVVPSDVVRVRVHPSITVIPERAFCEQRKLEEVELCDGLLEIGEHAFYECRALKHINIPSTVTTIGEWAFSYALDQCTSIQLPDSIESIGEYALSCHGNILTFRVPPLITTIPRAMLGCIKSLFSVEISDNVISMSGSVFSSSLRNIALGDNFDGMIGYCSQFPFGTLPFHHCADLLEALGLNQEHNYQRKSEIVINALKHRFDNLPIHKMIYYQSYNNVTVDQLNNATDIRISRRRSKLNPSGSQQDSLGMTPLHIMTCSTVQDISLYRVLIDKYPETLVTEDRWGALPLLYAVWGNAPSEIIQFLVDSYKSIYPDYELNWTSMFKTLGTVLLLYSELNGLEGIIQNLLDLQHESFSEQNIDWEKVLTLSMGKRRAHSAPLRFFVKCSIKKRVDAIGLQHFRDAIMTKVDSITSRVHPIGTYVPEDERLEFQTEVQTMLSQYETEYQNLKEATSVLELVLWKKSISEVTLSDDGRESRKRKFYETDRNQCRTSCGADIVIQHVLPYLLPN